LVVVGAITVHLPILRLGLQKLGSVLAKERQKRQCGTNAKAAVKPDNQYGVAIFPGQEPILGTVIAIEQKAIDSVVALDEKMNITPHNIAPWAAGCIRYVSPDGAAHQTGIIAIVDQVIEGKDGTYALPPDPTSIEPNRLRANVWVEGSYAN
jgi:hypothetical protein